MQNQSQDEKIFVLPVGELRDHLEERWSSSSLEISWEEVLLRMQELIIFLHNGEGEVLTYEVKGVLIDVKPEKASVKIFPARYFLQKGNFLTQMGIELNWGRVHPPQGSVLLPQELPPKVELLMLQALGVEDQPVKNLPDEVCFIAAEELFGLRSASMKDAAGYVAFMTETYNAAKALANAAGISPDMAFKRRRPSYR